MKQPAKNPMYHLLQAYVTSFVTEKPFLLINVLIVREGICHQLLQQVMLNKRQIN